MAGCTDRDPTFLLVNHRTGPIRKFPTSRFLSNLSLFAIMSKGTKRASPGADEEKNPLQAVELGEEDAKKLNEVQRESQRIELFMGRFCPLCPRIWTYIRTRQPTL